MCSKSILLLLISLVILSCKPEYKFRLIENRDYGITFKNTIVESDTFNILGHEFLYHGAGVGASDLNNDGLSDLIFVGNVVSPHVYQNQGGLQFQNITGRLLNLDTSQWFTGVSIADVNGDNLLDIYLTASFYDDPERRKNKLWINQGNDPKGIPSFKEMSYVYGVDDTGHSMHSAFFDYDLDGDLDLYVLNNTVGKEVPTNYRPKITDGTAANNDQLYRNNGDNTFSNVTLEAGISYEGFGLGLGISDINKDGYPDIYVSNDYIANDLLYINQRDGSFLNKSESLLSYHSKFSMGNDIADFNNDGFSDIITLDMMYEDYARQRQNVAGNSYYMYVLDEKFSYQHQYERNMLHQNNGLVNGELISFSENGQQLGVFQTSWSWSPLFADFDNDGDRDLFVTNGYPKDLTDKDWMNFKSTASAMATDLQISKRAPIVKIPNYNFENVGDKFENRAHQWGMDIASFSNGAAFSDLDNDGDLDYVVNNINDEPFIFENQASEKGSHFLQLSLKGIANNTQALGTKIELWSGGNYQYHEHYNSRGYLSTVDPVVHFGFKSSKIDSVILTWPTGDQTLILKPEIDQKLHVSQNQSILEKRKSKIPNGRFREVKRVIDFEHQQEDYIDFFQSQNIIPHKFSQTGPVMAKIDLNGDLQEDLVVGATNNQFPVAFINSDVGFKRTTIEGLSNHTKINQIGLEALDYDLDGDLDLIAISSAYEDGVDNEHFIYQNLNGSFLPLKLALPNTPFSVVKIGDYDGNGYPDLFLGGSVRKNNFPNSNSTIIWMNKNGQYEEVFNEKIGVVTDAINVDYNDDGLVDILVTREWDSPIPIENTNSGFKATEHTILSSKKGLWKSIHQADLDGDGDQDFLLGNLGANHRFTVNDNYPMSIYGTDIDDNGTIDPIISSFWKNSDGVMTEFPINYFDELKAQSPYFSKLFISYTNFSYAEMEDLIKTESIDPSAVLSVTELRSFVIWNNSGEFRWEVLDNNLQSAPISSSIKLDYNSDGIDDLLLMGNDHSFDISTGWMDSNKGQVLLGSADQELKLVPNRKTGLDLKGQVNQAIRIDSTFLFGVNRQAIKAYYLD